MFAGLRRGHHGHAANGRRREDCHGVDFWILKESLVPVIGPNVVVGRGLGMHGHLPGSLSGLLVSGVDRQGALAGGFGGVRLVDGRGPVFGKAGIKVGRGHHLGQVGHPCVDVGVEPRDSAAADESDFELAVHVRSLQPPGWRG